MPDSAPVSTNVRLMRRPTRVLGSSAGPAKLPRNLGELAYSAIAVFVSFDRLIRYCRDYLKSVELMRRGPDGKPGIRVAFRSRRH